MTLLSPSLRSVRIAETKHQSNSTELPMRYTPDPMTMVIIRLNVMSCVLVRVVGRVQVVGVRRRLASHRVDLLDEGRDAHLLAHAAFFSSFVRAEALGDLQVREARLFNKICSMSVPLRSSRLPTPAMSLSSWCRRRSLCRNHLLILVSS